MDLLLWRWSTAAQCASAVMIAIFFVVLARAVGRAELRPWATAWFANAVALLIPIAFWFLRPTSALVFIAMRWGYFFSKTLFVVLLVIGARYFGDAKLAARHGRRLSIAVFVYAFIATLLVRGIDQDGMLQSAVTAVILFGGCFLRPAKRAPGSAWLICGFAGRAALAVAEALAYATRVTPSEWSTSRRIAIFLSSTSSLDAGAEWMIALGCVLVFYRAIQRELTMSNRDLLATQGVLRELVERDPLTGLANRRSLPPVLHEAANVGAVVLFFDLDNFKEVNDKHGHQAGDECLRRFADALQEGLGADAHVARYAGDEFVAVLHGLQSTEIESRLKDLEHLLQSQSPSDPQIRYTVGFAHLAVGGNPDETLRAADAAMYSAKASKAAAP
jgi:diguanylate cyclase (GGDEF)-like protein